MSDIYLGGMNLAALLLACVAVLVATYLDIFRV